MLYSGSVACLYICIGLCSNHNCTVSLTFSYNRNINNDYFSVDFVAFEGIGDFLGASVHHLKFRAGKKSGGQLSAGSNVQGANVLHSRELSG